MKYTYDMSLDVQEKVETFNSSIKYSQFAPATISLVCLFAGYVVAIQLRNLYLVSCGAYLTRLLPEGYC
jgi:hypothetical protein